MIELNVMKLNLSARLPEYATDGLACFDLFALMEKSKTLVQGFPLIVRTGLAFEIPENHVMLIFSRSGHAFKNGARLGNCVGVIDSESKRRQWHESESQQLFGYSFVS